MVNKIITTIFVDALKRRIIEEPEFNETEFWDEIESEGTPIFEDGSNGSDIQNLTLLFKGNSSVQNIHFIPEICEGQSLEYTFERIEDTHIWYICIAARDDIKFEYSLLINDHYGDDWDERCKHLICDPLNKSFLFVEGDEGEEDEILSNIKMPQSAKHIWSEIKVPTVQGIIEEHHFKSKTLGTSRRIQIYLPPHYASSDEDYDVVLFNDGDEYITLLNANRVIDNLIGEKKMNSVIAIFVDSTDDRYDELLCNTQFDHFIGEELIPWVQLNYRIKENNSNHTIGGLSLGGLFACHVQLSYSEIFKNIISQSGAFWVKREEEIETGTCCWIYDEIQKRYSSGNKFYFDIGILEEQDTMIDLNKKVADLYRLKGGEVIYNEFGGGHDYLCWGETLAHALMHIYTFEEK